MNLLATWNAVFVKKKAIWRLTAPIPEFVVEHSYCDADPDPVPNVSTDPSSTPAASSDMPSEFDNNNFINFYCAIININFQFLTGECGTISALPTFTWSTLTLASCCFVQINRNSVLVSFIKSRFSCIHFLITLTQLSIAAIASDWPFSSAGLKDT